MSVDLSKTQSILNRYEELLSSVSDPNVLSDTERYLALSRELGELEEKANLVKKYFNLQNQLAEAREIYENESDKELRQLANEEFSEISSELETLENELKLLLAEKDPRDDRNVIMEIRAGTGGEEAALFSDTLLKMYRGYCISRGFSMEIIDANETELGGFKEVVLEISGKGAYSRFKFESGVHRVQRVPVTESGGRIHTSACTVAVLPEAIGTDVVINPDDLKIDRYRSSGAGGQHINKTSSAIRITHIPTGLVVQCQDERSQFKNKDKAMAVLKSRLWEIANKKDKDAEDSERKSQVGSGDRSERIRTYNYHQGRVTDHRVNLTLYRLEEILAGDLDEIIDSLTVYYASEEKSGGADNED